MSGAGLHKAGLSDLGDLGLREAGRVQCTHLQVTRWIPGGGWGRGVCSFSPLLGPCTHTAHSRPILQTCRQSPAEFGLEGLRRGEYSRASCTQLAAQDVI